MIHFAVEEDKAVVYHCARNSCRFMEYEEGKVVCDLIVAPVLEELLRRYPSYTTIATLSELLLQSLGNEGLAVAEYAPADERKESTRAILQGAIRDLFDCGALEKMRVF